MNESELCNTLKVNRSTVYIWRLQGMPFEMLENGKHRYSYDIMDVQNWLAVHGRKKKGGKQI